VLFRSLLEIDSDAGSGTRIVLYLPARHRGPRVRKKEKGQIPAPAHLPGKKKILLMDDEEAILSATSEMLKFLGYEVAVAHNGETALDLFRKARISGQPFDAVILDITIPGGMGAQETLPGLAALDPTVKAIISSGYSTNPMIVDYRTFGFVSAIVKPYGFKELGEALDTAFR
jgi:DNA-binding NtrC family response regulator